jgi:hypothetical protein
MPKRTTLIINNPAMALTFFLIHINSFALTLQGLDLLNVAEELPALFRSNSQKQFGLFEPQRVRQDLRG